MFKALEVLLTPESNVNLQPEEVTEKKALLQKSINVKTKVTKILCCQEANDEIEIDSD